MDQGLNAERAGDRVSVDGDGVRAETSSSGSPDANLALINASDEQAEETLQPLIDALGVRGDGESGG